MKKIRTSTFLILAFSLALSSFTFSEDDFGEGGFHHWQKRLIEEKDSKHIVLLEMLGETVREEDGLTFRILQMHGPHLFYGDNPDNKRDFQRLLLNIFKTNDLYKLRSFYGIKEGQSDLFVARVFQIVFYLYAVETGFTYWLRENMKGTLSWGWNDAAAPGLLTQIIRSMDEFLGPKVSYHIRARVKNIQNVGGIEEVVVVVEWELIEVESSYNPQKDALEATEKVIKKSAPVREFLSKEEANKIEGDYGTKRGLSLEERAAVIVLFKSFSMGVRIFENPSPRDIGPSNWERIVPLLPGGMSFVPIPESSFDMGSPSGEIDRDNNDEALHRVTLKSFEMMTTEVTQKQWEAVMIGNNPSYFKGEDLPVETVSWDDVQKFISKLNERNDGWLYRLPTEAEWEYAARGGTNTAYSFGDNDALLKEHGWYHGNAGGTTHPVASCPTKEKAKANGFGLYDMHGNVWEWVLDPYSSDYSQALSQEDANAGSFGAGSYRVFRGGCWGSAPLGLRSAYRDGYSPGGRGDGLGFRLARTRR